MLTNSQVENDNTIVNPIEVGDDNITKITLSDFVRDFSTGLLQAVKSQNPPLYNGEPNIGRAAVMSQLKRQPFQAQQKVVQAVTHLLIDKNAPAAIINAEMGTGKTMMGIACAAILHEEGFRKALVLSPPHLVYKWRREIMETVPDAKVWVLNGPDALMKLLTLREQLSVVSEQPEFFIIGRVRLRMGYHWKPAFVIRCQHVREFTNSMDECSLSFVRTYRYASCPHCGAFVTDTDGTKMLAEHFPLDRTLNCSNLKCAKPLWTLMRRQEQQSSKEGLIKALCKLPTIGPKRAAQLIAQFSQQTLMSMLSDNIYQFVNLMDDNGELVFSDRQAQRLEKALAKMEFSFGQGGYQLTEFIKRYLPQGFFSLLLVDEGHEYKSMGSAQGQAMGVLASKVTKTILLTGTLMGGYADDLFHLLWRINPSNMQKKGYGYSQRGSISAAALAFMEQHGVLKRVFRNREVNNHLTARGRRQSMSVSRAPGFGPQGVANFVLPYTAFLKLAEIGHNVLPPYEEHFIEVSLNEEQASYYQQLEGKLLAELKAALRKGDRTLLGVILNCLLAWPDCCFREEAVHHPRRRQLLAYTPSLLGEEETSPKEQMMIDLCLKAKAKGQKALVYTTYTGNRDTASRLKLLLEQSSLKTAVLRASIDTDKREDWIAEQLDRHIDVLVCNPELVKTGLDLLEFPTIIFMQSGFNVYTLMQASRRSWRIGQKLSVNVYFLGYSNTAQIKCLELMAKKIAVTQSTAGTMPETGLDVLNQDSDTVEVALAKQLVH